MGRTAVGVAPETFVSDTTSSPDTITAHVVNATPRNSRLMNVDIVTYSGKMVTTEE